MRVIITGGMGQLGWELQRTAPSHIEVLITDVGEMDITDVYSVNKVFESFTPSVIINAAAYTAVDKAEDEKELAFKINEEGVRNILEASKKYGSYIIHISTDFVFSGSKGFPYKPLDKPEPLCVYGESKLKGEQLLIEHFPEKSFIVRTAWLYSAHGNNFVKTMLKLFENPDRPVRVVSDQIGTPTWAFNLARFLWFLVENIKSVPVGIYHFTDAGVASWYDFAVAIEEETRDWRGYEVEIIPIASMDFPAKAKRPPFSVLDKEKSWKIWREKPEHWRKALRKMLKELKEGIPGVIPRQTEETAKQSHSQKA